MTVRHPTWMPACVRRGVNRCPHNTSHHSCHCSVIPFAGLTLGQNTESPPSFSPARRGGSFLTAPPPHVTEWPLANSALDSLPKTSIHLKRTSKRHQQKETPLEIQCSANTWGLRPLSSPFRLQKDQYSPQNGTTSRKQY